MGHVSGNQRGTAMLELALVLPLLLLLLFGTIEMALLFYNKQVLANATREGARCCINSYIEKSDKEIMAIVTTYCTNMVLRDLNGTEEGVAVSQPIHTIDPAGTEFISISASYEYHFFFASLLGMDKTLITAQTTMSIQ